MRDEERRAPIGSHAAPASLSFVAGSAQSAYRKPTEVDKVKRRGSTWAKRSRPPDLLSLARPHLCSRARQERCVPQDATGASAPASGDSPSFSTVPAPDRPRPAPPLPRRPRPRHDLPHITQASLDNSVTQSSDPRHGPCLHRLRSSSLLSRQARLQRRATTRPQACNRTRRVHAASNRQRPTAR